MLALTVWQPYAWAIAKGYKLIENRTWSPPESVVGQRFAVHAGKRRPTVREWAELRADLPHRGGGPLPEHVVIPQLDELAFGAVVATARLQRWARGNERLPDWLAAWFSGPYGWILEDVVELAPIPVAGKQGIWRLPVDVADQVAELELEALGRLEPGAPGARRSR